VAVCLSIYLSIFPLALCVYICLSVYMSVCLSLSLHICVVNAVQRKKAVTPLLSPFSLKFYLQYTTQTDSV